MAGESDFGVTLEPFFAYDDDFGVTLWSLLHLNAALRALWRHVGFTLGALAACGVDFGGTLGSFWGQVWVSLALVWVSVGDFG